MLISVILCSFGLQRTLLTVIRLALTGLVSAPVPSWAATSVMFEGYSAILAGEAPLGYVVQRYELEQSKKQLTSTYLVKTPEATESLKAVANDAFQPISYQYTMKDGDKIKLIDIKFANNKMTGTITEGKVTKKINKKLEPGAFLSSFLGYLMLQKGIGVGKNFLYKAVAEENGEVHSGEAWVKEETTYKGHKVYRIENTFKDAKFTSFVTLKGEVLATSSIDSNLKTELKPSASEATKGFPVPQDTLKLLFGSVPKGETHSLARSQPTTGGSPTPPGGSQPGEQTKVTGQ